MTRIILSACFFFGYIGGGVVSSAALESESCTVSAFPEVIPGTSSAFAKDVPVAAVVEAAG
jgi:hypothetical protein